jgi:hypothetical protein
MIRLALFAASLILILPAIAQAQDPSGTPTAPSLTASVGEKITFTDVNVDGPYIAMTFDDGPHATNTAKLLEIAAKRHISYFFVLGEAGKTRPFSSVVAEGHEIGNHPGRTLIWRSFPMTPSHNQLQRTETSSSRPQE